MDLSQPTEKRARSSQACQACRNLKAACLPSKQAGVCQRCLAFERQCIWSEGEAKAKKPRGPSRISQVERKIDGLVAHFTEDQNTAKSHTLTEPSESLSFFVPSQRQSQSSVPLTPASSVPQYQSETGLDHRLSLAELEDIHDFDLLTSPDSTSVTHAVDPRNQDSLADDLQNLLDRPDHRSLLDDYRSISASFPFVPIPTTLTFDEMLKRKPILLLAVLLAASCKQPKLQLILEERYRREIGKRTLIEPRKSVALVQSMLIYLSWYHFHFNHKIQNIYPLLQLVVGIAIDLGLHQASKPSVFSNRSEPRLSAEYEREEQRTILGCYYLSSAISNGLRKPNLFRLTKYLLKCVERLHHDLELTSDVCLSSLVNAQRLEDELFDICAAEFVDEHRLLNLSRIKTSLMDLRKETSRNGNQRLPTLLLHYSEMVLCNFRPQAEGMAVLNSDLHSKEELEAVRSAAEAGRAVLDTLVDCPVSEYSSISFVEWMRLPQVISTLSKVLFLADGSASKSRIAEIRDHVRLDLYLESLCYRMQTLTTFKPPEQPRVDFWVAMRVVLDKMREFYVRHMRQRTFGGRSERGPEVNNQTNWRNNSTNVSTTTPCLPDESSAPQISLRSEGLTPETADQSIPELPNMEFSLDEFLQMEFWGGSASYDPTIERNEWGDV